MLVSVEKPGSPAEVLEHFGTKGMRWGVRKSEDVSIGTKRVGPKSSKPAKTISDRKERRAKGHEVRAGLAQKRIDELQAQPKAWAYTQRQRNNQVKELEKFRDKETKAAKDIRAGHMTDFQKKAIVGAAVVGTVIAAYGTYKMVDSGTARQMLDRTPLKTNDLLSRKMSPDSIMKEVVAPINPNYGELGTKMNCRRATFAYEMRRRGMDVKATKTVKGAGQTATGMLNATNPKNSYRTDRFSILANLAKEKGEGPVSEAVKFTTGREPIGKWPFEFTNGIERSNTIFSALAEHPEGARGELGMRWKTGGAHSMAWEIINGGAHIFDAQSGEMFTPGGHEFDKVAARMSEVGATRLDNLNLNQDYLRRWVTNVK